MFHINIKLSLVFVLIIIFSIHSPTSKATSYEGTTTLNQENNWVFSEHSEKIKINSEISLQWTTNGSTTGWLICSEENQVARAINSTQTGNLLLNADENSCSVVIYRVYKPQDTSIIYLVTYSYAWIFDESTKSGFLILITVPSLILTFSVCIFLKKKPF